MATPVRVSPKEDQVGLAVLTMALAVTFFTGIDTSAKWLMLSGLALIQVVFVRYAVNFLFVLVLFLPRHGPSVLRSQAPVRQLLRSVFFLGSTVLNFAALKSLPITVTTTIMFSGPIVVTLLAIPILGEKVGIRRFIAVCVGFLGVVVVMQPWGTGFHPAMLLTCGAVISASMYFVMTRLLAGIESNATSQIIPTGLATLCLAPFALPVWQWPETTSAWVALGVIGVFGGLGHIAATAAHRWADASLLAPVVYFQLFLATASGVLVFGAWPTWWTLIGGLIIIASGVFIWQRERAKRRQT